MCLGFITILILSRVHSQSCHSVQSSFTILSFCPEFIHNPVILPSSFTILSFCPEFIHNPVIVSRPIHKSCHSVQGPFTILSMCLGFIHNHSCCFRAGPLFGVWEIKQSGYSFGCDRSGRSRISGLFIDSTVPDLTWWQCSLCCCQLGCSRLA